MHADPGDDLAWYALADWLADHQGPEPAELARLYVQLRRLGWFARRRRALEVQAQALLIAGARPVVPALENSLGMTLVLVPPGSFCMGNSREWCADPGPGPSRVMRGGGFRNPASVAGSGRHNRMDGVRMAPNVGFRVALTAVQAEKRRRPLPARVE